MSQNSANKENAVDLAPSRAWIRNIGPGSSRKLLQKNLFNRNKNQPANSTAMQPPRNQLLDTTPKSQRYPKPREPNSTVIDLNKTGFVSKVRGQLIEATPKPQRNPRVCESNNTVIALDETSFVSTVDASQVIVVEDTILDDATATDTAANETVFESCVGNDTISGVEPLNHTTLIGSAQKRAVNTSNIARPEPAKVSQTYSLIEIASDISSSDETSDFFDKSDEIQVNRTIMPLNSTIASETCIRMDKAATELWKMHISKGAKKLLEDPTIMPSYAQFLTDKTNKNWTLNSPPKRTDVQQCPQVASTSSDEYIQPVYMREEDVNRLFNKGYIYLAQGKMHYREPQQRRRQF